MNEVFEVSEVWPGNEPKPWLLQMQCGDLGQKSASVSSSHYTVLIH